MATSETELRSRKPKADVDDAKNNESLVEQAKAQMKELHADVNDHISDTKVRLLRGPA